MGQAASLGWSRLGWCWPSAALSRWAPARKAPCSRDAHIKCSGTAPKQLWLRTGCCHVPEQRPNLSTTSRCAPPEALCPPVGRTSGVEILIASVVGLLRCALRRALPWQARPLAVFTEWLSCRKILLCFLSRSCRLSFGRHMVECSGCYKTDIEV